MLYGSKIKTFAISFVVGCLLTVLSLVFFMIPRNGPSLLISILVIPAQMISSKIAPDPQLGEMVFWGLIISFWTVLSFLFLSIIQPFFHRGK
jgi:hypothetical protein